ncbi:MAG: hypothetical protein IT203_03645 [Fimbriimonadaceae bacterium]|nr:hypothetical protein [Fimbriimonadaceae bacterium]
MPANLLCVAVIANAQIRGGADMGIAWHDQGKMIFKQEYLHRLGGGRG